MNPTKKSKAIKRLAGELGFARCGIARAEPIGRKEYVRQWLASGRAGSMDYMHRYFAQRTDPRELLPDAQSVIVVAHLYNQPHPPADERDRSPRGKVAMYAWGQDYHEVLRKKFWALVDGMRETLDEPFEAKVCVDTAPLLEREFAAAAGIGWIGKNTLVLHQDLGSYFFLGAIVTTLELPADQPLAEHCGTCTACLDACPTGAFPAPHEMDASRCISYLTIEHRGDISKPFQEMMGDWLFGCDICQQVCPFNRDAPVTNEPAFAPCAPAPAPCLDEIRGWSKADYEEHLAESAVKRATLEMLKRNAEIAMTNLMHGVAGKAVEPSGAYNAKKSLAADSARRQGELT